jgi:hypothetical protein
LPGLPISLQSRLKNVLVQENVGGPKFGHGFRQINHATGVRIFDVGELFDLWRNLGELLKLCFVEQAALIAASRNVSMKR